MCATASPKSTPLSLGLPATPLPSVLSQFIEAIGASVEGASEVTFPGPGLVQASLACMAHDGPSYGLKHLATRHPIPSSGHRWHVEVSYFF